jgi:hypothetical protein
MRRYSLYPGSSRYRQRANALRQVTKPGGSTKQNATFISPAVVATFIHLFRVSGRYRSNINDLGRAYGAFLSVVHVRGNAVLLDKFGVWNLPLVPVSSS